MKTATSWKSGQSGNAKGRPPKGHSVTEMVKQMMDEQPELKRSLVTKIVNLAIEGDLTAIKLIWNYMDGMPTHSIGEVNNEPVEFVFRHKSEV